MNQYQGRYVAIARGFSLMLICMSEWADELVANFAASMKKRRDKLGLSAQKLADRTVELGHPVNRSVVAALESGRRKRLLLPDAIVLAAALETSLAHLLFPEMPDRKTEYLPGRTVSEWTAACRLLGIDPSGATAWEHLDDREAEEIADWMRDLGIVLPVQLSHDLKLVQHRSQKLKETIQATGDVGLLSEVTELSAKAGSLTERLESMGGVVARPGDRRDGVVDG